jgi:heme/copper-type cytochrome/quinol oxidase subunit 3
MATMLALPPGGRERPRNLITVATALTLSGGLTLFAALIGAWFYVKHINPPWPPKGVKIDNYLGTMLSVTALMAGVTAEWAVHAIRKEDKSQSAFALGITAVFGLAILNLLWYLGRTVGFGPGKTPFAVVFFALISASGFVFLTAVVVAIVAMARTLGRQMSPASHEMLRATAMYWHFAVVTWLSVWATIWWLG